jgi:beta-glucosidase
LRAGLAEEVLFLKRMKIKITVHCFALFFCTSIAFSQSPDLFRNSNEPVEKRISDLISRLTIEEKIALTGYNSPGVPRLGIPAYNWWNEGLHGVARAGLATVFPQAIGMAATFNDNLLLEVADVISTEARAKYNLSTETGRRLQYMGLTFWSPNINIFRDPRWGRGQETYGEDPFLTASMGTAFVRGLQGNDPTYLKAAAAAKHFAVHSGPEKGRHGFNAIVDEKDLRETYLYAFKKLVDEGVESIMCAYNRINDQPCCASPNLLQNILRSEWKFKGHIVTDCGALDDIVRFHKVLNNNTEAAAAGLKAGVNLDCSNLYQKNLLEAYSQKLITEKQIDSSLTILLRTQFKLGLFDDKKNVPFSKLGSESVNSPYHIELARKAAQQSMVLLKNDKGLLPLTPNKYGSIMVLGPNAASMDPMVANYHGMSGNVVTFAEGITAAAGPATAVQYDQGSDFTDTTHFGGIWAAGESDITIAVIGLTPVYEGEGGDAFLAANGGDKLTLDLPAAHIGLLKELRKKNKPVVVVVTAGSNVDISAIEPYADAIILAWYPGEQGGNALADILFGKVSPAGRLPVTFYQSFNDLPAYDNYAMKGRTYRYYDGKVQFPFGYGLSYSTFMYEWQNQPLQIKSSKDTVSFSVTIKNTGAMDADEVAQVYIQYPAVERMPLKELKSFQRVHVEKNGEAVVQFRIPLPELQKWDLKQKKWALYPGNYTIVVGSNSQDVKLKSVVNIKAGLK